MAKCVFFHLQLVNSIAKTYVGTNAYMAVSHSFKYSSHLWRFTPGCCGRLYCSIAFHLVWLDGLPSAAWEDIRRAVWHPRRCLERGDLFHGGWLFIIHFNIFHMAFSYWQVRIRCMPVCSGRKTKTVLISALPFFCCLPTDIIDFPSVSDYSCLSAVLQMMQASASALFVNSVWYYYNYKSNGWLYVWIIDMIFRWWRWTSIMLLPVGLISLSPAVDMYI